MAGLCKNDLLMNVHWIDKGWLLNSMFSWQTQTTDSELLPVIFKLTGRAMCFIQANQCAKPHQWASTHIALQPPNYNPNCSYRQQQYDRRRTCGANHCALHLQKQNSDPFSQRWHLRALSVNLPPDHCHLLWSVLHHKTPIRFGLKQETELMQTLIRNFTIANG